MSSRPSRGAARLAAILDALPDALLLVNCNGTVVNANTIALEAFEAPGTALVGRGLLDLLPEFDAKRIPGSMRRPDEAAAELEERQRPTRMVARRTDGSEFNVEVTSANLEDGRTPYASAFEAAFADHGAGSGNSYTGDELLMLVVRDLTGTLDTEAELARQQRQTEMILRAASEGVIGVDTDGVIVLVNPATDSGPLELTATLVKDRPRRVSLVDPDGKPVVGAQPLVIRLKLGVPERAHFWPATTAAAEAVDGTARAASAPARPTSAGRETAMARNGTQLPAVLRTLIGTGTNALWGFGDQRFC